VTWWSWLRAQIAEDEAVARAADVKQDDPHWRSHGPLALHEPRAFRVRSDRDCRPIAYVTDLAGDDEADTTGILDGEAVAEHIARWDPERVLAECAAKRAILEGHHPIDPCDAHDTGFGTIPCDTVLSLAQPYADRPGFDPAWRIA